LLIPASKDENNKEGRLQDATLKNSTRHFGEVTCRIDMTSARIPVEPFPVVWHNAATKPAAASAGLVAVTFNY